MNWATKTVISFFMVIVFVAFSLIPVLASDVPDIYTAPTIEGQGTDNIFVDWQWIYDSSTINILQYNRGGTTDKGIRINNATNKHVLAYATAHNIIPGYTYLFQFKTWNYNDQIDAAIYTVYPTIIQDAQNTSFPGIDAASMIDPVKITLENGQEAYHYRTIDYAFKAPLSTYQDYSLNDYAIVFDLLCKSSSVFWVAKNIEIICLDQIVTNALRQINANEQDIKADTAQIVSYLYSALYEQNNNFGEYLTTLRTWADWWVDNNPETTVGPFYEKYGERFSIALYELLREALIGDRSEYETDPAVSDNVSEYNDLESQLVQDKSADLSNALGQGSGALTNNNALSWIKQVMESTVFYNSKITTYIIFALGMGLVVLTLGRKIKV